MGIRFRKSVKIAPGVRLNIGKKSAGISVGGKFGGVSYNSKTGARERFSIPGTGVSYSEKIGSASDANPTLKKHQTIRREVFSLAMLIVIAGILAQILISQTGLGILWWAYIVVVIIGIGRFVNTIKKINKHTQEQAREGMPVKNKIDGQQVLAEQDAQLASIWNAENSFEATGDIDELVEFWENIWASGGLRFNGSKWTFRLPDLYIMLNQYDDALRILDQIKNPDYSDKVSYYKSKIMREKSKMER